MWGNSMSDIKLNAIIDNKTYTGFTAFGRAVRERLVEFHNGITDDAIRQGAGAIVTHAVLVTSYLELVIVATSMHGAYRNEFLAWAIEHMKPENCEFEVVLQSDQLRIKCK